MLNQNDYLGLNLDYSILSTKQNTHLSFVFWAKYNLDFQSQRLKMNMVLIIEKKTP